ncbi:MAG: sulfate transporter CysZ [Francisellaceae bacterium]
MNSQEYTTKFGAHYLFNGFRLISERGMKRFVIIPLIINIFVFIALWWYAFYELSILTTWVEGLIPGWLAWLGILIYAIAIVGLLLFTAYAFSTIALIVASPFYGFLAEKIQLKLTNQPVGSTINVTRLLLIAPKAMIRELSKMLSFLPWVILILVCYFIPGLNLITSLMWFVLLSWINVVQYADYAFDNNDISFAIMKKQLGSKKTLSLSFGAITTLLLIVPFLSIIVIPAAIAGSTAMYIDHWHDKD